MTHDFDVAEYRGETFRTSTSEAAEGHVWLIRIGEQAPERQVPIADLDAWYRDRTTATWRGQPFRVGQVRNGTATVDYVGHDGTWAAQNGLQGDRYNGFYGTISAAELEDVRVDRTDHLARWKKENLG
ncbi:hypothetical protein AB0A63_36320 [Lentzea sp. NPDC042327]|uniref:hypothetical protein n=1 Tax=Lentzea sp. NPDC042327 TaxID=3154801 RepID=UPI003405C987